MALFDIVHCRYPLPHHQSAVFRTMDVNRVVWDEGDTNGPTWTYDITINGQLRRQAAKPRRLSESERSVENRSEAFPDAHGDMFLYTFDDRPGKKGKPPIEFRVRFTNGVVQDVLELIPRSAGHNVARPMRPVPRRRFRLIRCHAMRVDARTEETTTHE